MMNFKIIIILQKFMEINKKVIAKSGKTVESVESKQVRETSMNQINAVNEEFEVNPPLRILSDRQRHVLIGIIGMSIVCLMSFSLLKLLNILK